MELLTTAVKKCRGKAFIHGTCANFPSSSSRGVHGKEEVSTSGATPMTPSKSKRWRKRRFWRKKRKPSWKEHVEGLNSAELAKRGESEAIADLVNNMASKSDITMQVYAAEEILRITNDNIPSRVFSFKQLCDATNKFNVSNLIGEGGFGRVYKGHPQDQDTQEVMAVKQLDKEGFQGNREFLVEVLMLSLLHHPNLVKLLGYSTDYDQRILLYEYMPNGSLEDHLLDLPPNAKALPWNTRMKIAFGAAKGLEYLHEVANPPVIYRDLKASNILLDKDFHPKLSDFGLAKLGPIGDKTHVSTRVMGTYGYCAPEYAMTGKLTKMSDIYSFGVVLLVLITGRRAIDTARPTEEQYLLHWTLPLLKDRKRFMRMADPSLEGRYPMKGLYQALAIASMCILEDAGSRPTISDVVAGLGFLVDQKYYPRQDIQAGQKALEECKPRPRRRGRNGSNLSDIKADDESKHR